MTNVAERWRNYMKFKLIKNIVASCIFLAMVSAFAQNNSKQGFLFCNEMSKDPRCWQEQGNDTHQYPYECLPKNSCHIIKSIYQDAWGRYNCKSTSAISFNCDELVQDYGRKLAGFVVKVTMPNIDSCHVPGGCGSKTCLPGYGSASLDQACQ